MATPDRGGVARRTVRLVGRRQDAAFFFHARAVADLPQARTYEHDAGGVYFAESHAADLAPQILDFTAGLRTSD